MTSDVVLSAAMRSNLLSLQNTQNGVDVTQNRLATGKKVNSALDGPQAFFASQALTNRASDLTRLLDGIGQSIQVIKAADNGVTALTKLIEQADSIAANAQEALASGQAEAKVVGDVDLRGIDDLTDLGGGTAVPTTSTLTFRLTNDEGEAIQIGAYSTGAASATPTATVTINTDDNIEELIAEINNIHIDNGSDVSSGGQAFEASLNEKGQLQIRTLNGGNFSVDFDSATAGDPADLAFANALGFSDIARVVSDGAGTNNISFSAIAKASLTSFALTYTDAGGVQQTALRSSTLDTLDLDDGTALFANIANGDADVYQISVNGGTRVDIALADAGGAVSIQDFIDDINDNDTLNSLIRADFDESTGQLTISAIDASVVSIETGVQSTTSVTANFGFGLQDSDPGVNDLTAGAGAANAERETIRLGAAAATLAGLEEEFENIRAQIDALVEDTSYRGTNLLNGDDLLTVFNENRSSSLTTSGVTFTASGLGLEEANFSRTTSVDGALTAVREALAAVRNFGSTLANDLTIIQTRQSFTTSLINTLKEGSDKLVNADQNEEGAKLLALQTRQSLGVTSLSLASQSQQSILRLF